MSASTPRRAGNATKPDPVDDAVPIDKIRRKVNPPTEPNAQTARDDDEGGADAVDPDTGKPYRNRDPGVDAPAAGRKGGSGGE